MKEIWELAISPQVLPLTILLVPIALYWLLSVCGVVDLEFLDVDLDTHGPDASGGFLQGMLRIVNASDVPLMVVISILSIILWAGAMIGNLWFNPDQSGFIGGGVALVSLVVSVVLTRLVVTPLKPFFRLIRADDEKHARVVGMTGAVRTAFVDERSGQVEVEVQGAPLLLNAKVAAGSDALPKNTEVIVITHDPGSGVCTVRAISESIPSQSP